MFMKKKVAEIKLLSLKNFLIVFAAGLLSWRFAIDLRDFFAKYNVWYNVLAFAVIFMAFWIMAYGMEYGVKILKKVTQKRS